MNFWLSVFLGVFIGLGLVASLWLVIRKIMREEGIDHPELPYEEDPYLMVVAQKAWESGKQTIGEVDEDGNLRIRVIEPAEKSEGGNERT